MTEYCELYYEGEQAPRYRRLPDSKDIDEWMEVIAWNPLYKAYKVSCKCTQRENPDRCWDCKGIFGAPTPTKYRCEGCSLFQCSEMNDSGGSTSD